MTFCSLFSSNYRATKSNRTCNIQRRTSWGRRWVEPQHLCQDRPAQRGASRHQPEVPSDRVLDYVDRILLTVCSWGRRRSDWNGCFYPNVCHRYYFNDFLKNKRSCVIGWNWNHNKHWPMRWPESDVIFFRSIAIRTPCLWFWQPEIRSYKYKSVNFIFHQQRQDRRRISGRKLNRNWTKSWAENNWI